MCGQQHSFNGMRLAEWHASLTIQLHTHSVTAVLQPGMPLYALGVRLARGCLCPIHLQPVFARLSQGETLFAVRAPADTVLKVPDPRTEAGMNYRCERGDVPGFFGSTKI